MQKTHPLVMVVASAPGKCILFGEHAVVYGQPAVAVAIEQRVSINVETHGKPGSCWKLDGSELIANKHPHLVGMRDRLWHNSPETPSLDIRIDSDIPSAAGLGSSAALSVAFAAALRTARGRRIDSKGWCEGFSSEMNTDPYKQPKRGVDPGFLRNGGRRLLGKDSLDNDECAILAHAVEAQAQKGRASPIDSSTVSHGVCTLLSNLIETGLDWRYSRSLETTVGKRIWEVHDISIPEDDVWLVIGNTRKYSSTSEQVTKVAKLLHNEPDRMSEIETIGSVTRRGVEALKVGDMEKVGTCMTENHLLLRGLGLSSPELENLVKAAAPSSLGVKLTGAGSGGCMIALTKDARQTAEAIELAGGSIIVSRIGSRGVEVEDDSNTPFWTPGVANS